MDQEDHRAPANPSQAATTRPSENPGSSIHSISDNTHQQMFAQHPHHPYSNYNPYHHGPPPPFPYHPSQGAPPQPIAHPSMRPMYGYQPQMQPYPQHSSQTQRHSQSPSQQLPPQSMNNPPHMNSGAPYPGPSPMTGEGAERVRLPTPFSGRPTMTLPYPGAGIPPPEARGAPPPPPLASRVYHEGSNPPTQPTLAPLGGRTIVASSPPKGGVVHGDAKSMVTAIGASAAAEAKVAVPVKEEETAAEAEESGRRKLPSRQKRGRRSDIAPAAGGPSKKTASSSSMDEVSGEAAEADGTMRSNERDSENVDEDDDDDDDDEDIHEVKRGSGKRPITARRRQINREASQRFRARRKSRMEELESQVEALYSEKLKLEVQVEMYEKERREWVLERMDYQTRIADLTAQLDQARGGSS